MTKSKPKRKAVGAAWRSRKGLHTLVALADAERRTGLSPDELRDLHGVQTVLRIYADGTREEALRVPTELVVEGRDGDAARRRSSGEGRVRDP